MPLADGTKAQNESAAVLRRAGLIGVPDDAGIEQSRSLERIFAEKVSPDQTTLCLIQFSMRRERVFHLGGTRLENVQQVPMPAFEILQDVAQLPGGRVGIEPENPVD